MSSLLRRFQKRAMKNQGYYRNRSGDIVSPVGDVVSRAPRDENGNSVGVARWPFPKKTTDGS